MKQLHQRILFLISLLFFQPCLGQIDHFIGQTIQINTHFCRVVGCPTWLIVIRDCDSQRVTPYLFDMSRKDNSYVIFTLSRHYQVTISNLKFGPCRVINNFCHIENGVINGKSMLITLSGKLSPCRNSINCQVTQYRDMPFPIVMDS